MNLHLNSFRIVGGNGETSKRKGLASERKKKQLVKIDVRWTYTPYFFQVFVSPKRQVPWELDSLRRCQHFQITSSQMLLGLFSVHVSVTKHALL